jgi:hypothetical protein
MDFALYISLSVLFLILTSAAWVSSVFQIPGNWVMLLLALLYGWFEGFSAVRPWVLITGLCLFIAAEGLEWASGYCGAKSFGGSRWSGVFAIIGAVAGAILGASFGYGLGAIPGTVMGAFLGALAVEVVRQRHAGKAIWAGIGAALGRAFGLSVKLGAGALFLSLLYLRVLWALFNAALYQGLP